ncbi:MAG: hydroxyisourate hydrolase [Zoogloea sp.]|nr:hydroxyisourate hydrolase [Zoogloea sp.]MCA0187633.1 hydroxyisourate hydrolase [Pseudomonadota bacterium]
MGRLTTHVLDTARGCPAAGMAYTLHAVAADGSRRLLCSGLTNHDGRAAAPLLEGDALVVGNYELVFEVAAYFAAAGVAQAAPPFLGSVPLAFGIADPAAHYHVPLLVSPWSYSTYRGS